jgi:hypothetical protein
MNASVCAFHANVVARNSEHDRGFQPIAVIVVRLFRNI